MVRFSRRSIMWLAFLAVVSSVTVIFVTGAGAVTGSPSSFESGDGNMTLNATSHTDWNCFQGTDKFASLASGTPAGCVATSGATQTWADGGTNSVGSDEFQFKSGTKFDDECPVINTGNNPPKDEWSNIAEYTEAAANKDLYFYGASIRPVVNGNSSGNVYFNQGTNGKGAGCHTVGDILLTFDFLQGGGSPSLHSLTWIGSGSCYVSSDSAPCWGNQQTINSANFDGNINTNPIAATDNAISGTALPVNAFAEFGINLTQAIKQSNPSATLPCFANQTWVSRSSGSSFTSNPEDVEVVNRPTCGTITLIKHTLDGLGNRSGLNQAFSFSSTGGLNPASPSLNDATGSDVTCTGSNTCNKVVYPSLQAGTYTITEGTNPPNFAFVSASCTGAGASTSGKVATINLGFGGDVTCTYVNQQQLGAIKVTKKSVKTGNPVLPGATFTVKDSTGTTVANGTLTTGSDGTACVDGLPFGTYTVNETAAPNGYAINDTDPNTAGNQTSKSVPVSTAGACSGTGATQTAVTFLDTPLTDLSVEAKSQASGGTKSTISCVDSATTPNSVASASLAEDAKASATGLKPGTYTCTVVVDP